MGSLKTFLLNRVGIVIGDVDDRGRCPKPDASERETRELASFAPFLPRRPDQSAKRIPYEKRAGFPPSLSVTRRSDASSLLFFEHRILSRNEATLYERVSVRWSVGWSVRPSVTLLSNSMKNGLLWILSD